MSKPITLEAMVRRLSRMAEQQFDAEGKLPMIWLVDTPEGIQLVCSPVCGGPETDWAKYKNLLAAAMREFFLEHGVTRYVVATEAWVAAGSEAEAESVDRHVAEHGTIANFPGRREAICIEGQDDRERLFAMRDIVRSASRKPYLTKLEIEPMQDMGEGRFSNLLPRIGALH